VFKLFTLEGATRMLPLVEERLQAFEDAVRELHEAQERLVGAETTGVEAQAARQEQAFLVRATHDARREVERLGVEVPDLETGVVEFPSRLGGEVVHLVWERGDHAITRYHRLTGDESPRPLEPAAPPASAPSG
jgi:hypothetical protein